MKGVSTRLIHWKSYYAHHLSFDCLILHVILSSKQIALIMQVVVFYYSNIQMGYILWSIFRKSLSLRKGTKRRMIGNCLLYLSVAWNGVAIWMEGHLQFIRIIRHSKIFGPSPIWAVGRQGGWRNCRNYSWISSIGLESYRWYQIRLVGYRFNNMIMWIRMILGWLLGFYDRKPPNIRWNSVLMRQLLP